MQKPLALNLAAFVFEPSGPFRIVNRIPSSLSAFSVSWENVKMCEQVQVQGLRVSGVTDVRTLEQLVDAEDGFRENGTLPFTADMPRLHFMDSQGGIAEGCQARAQNRITKTSRSVLFGPLTLQQEIGTNLSTRRV